MDFGICPILKKTCLIYQLFSVVIMQELAKEYKFEFTTMAADIDEQAIRFSDPKTLVLAIANAKV